MYEGSVQGREWASYPYLSSSRLRDSLPPPSLPPSISSSLPQFVLVEEHVACLLENIPTFVSASKSFAKESQDINVKYVPSQLLSDKLYSSASLRSTSLLLPPSLPSLLPSSDPVLSLTKLEESLEPLPLESLVVIEPPVEPAAVTSTPDNLAPSEEPLQPPTWRSHINTGKDILDDVRM